MRSSQHLENSIKLPFLGQTDISHQLSGAHHQSVAKHNAEVDQNRHILSRVIDCIKFCGGFELALRGHDEGSDSENPGVFRGLVDFVAEIDSSMKEFLASATVFKGTSHVIQNELLEIMFTVLQEKIKQEIRDADFYDIISDDTTDISSHTTNVVVIRCMVGSTVVERFWKSSQVKEGSAKAIADNLVACVEDILPKTEDKAKLIAPYYDRAAVMKGEIGDVQSVMCKKYPMAKSIHCYAHQSDLIMQQVLCSAVAVRVFFAKFNGFSSFFSQSPKWMAVLEECTSKRIPGPSATR